MRFTFDSTVLMCLVLSLGGVSTAGGPRAQGKRENKSLRVQQARELLGRHYRGSVVRVTEKIDAVRSFVEKEVRSKLPSKSKKLVKKTVDQIMTEARRYGLDPLFILAVILRESSMNPNAVGLVGETGLMQVRPETAKWIAGIYKMDWAGPGSLKDPAVNIQLGAAYLDYLRERFDRHSRLYLSAYNMGPGNVRQSLSRSVWPKDYSNSVMEHYIRLYSEIRETSQVSPRSAKTSVDLNKVESGPNQALRCASIGFDQVLNF